MTRKLDRTSSTSVSDSNHFTRRSAWKLRVSSCWCLNGLLGTIWLVAFSSRSYYVILSFYSKRPSTEECLEHRWFQPSEHMLKKRERASFLGHRLKVSSASQFLNYKISNDWRCRPFRTNITKRGWRSRQNANKFYLLSDWAWADPTAARRTSLQPIELSTILHVLNSGTNISPDHADAPSQLLTPLWS